MTHSIEQIAAALGAAFEGDGTLTVARAAEPGRAGPDALAVATSARWLAALGDGSARAALVPPGTDWRAHGLSAAIFAPRGRLAMARLTGLLVPAPDRPGIHPGAVIDPTAAIGTDVSIGPFCVIGADARIGDGCILDAQVTVGAGVCVGAGGRIAAGVHLAAGTRIGARVILQPGVVIGGDGFSFVTEDTSAAETARATLGQGAAPAGDPTWHRIHSLGGVTIGDDVEIGANSCVDAGTLRPTAIGDGTKIDSLVQVGHNAVVGAHCLLCAQAGIAGSASLGDRTVVGGKAGVGDNLTVGADVVLGGGTIVLSNVPAGRVMLGYPAMPIETQIAAYKALRRLPRILARLARLPNGGTTD